MNIRFANYTQLSRSTSSLFNSQMMAILGGYLGGISSEDELKRKKDILDKGEEDLLYKGKKASENWAS